jgi:hypothetical protein
MAEPLHQFRSVELRETVAIRAIQPDNCHSHFAEMVPASAHAPCYRRMAEQTAVRFALVLSSPE